VRKRFYVEFYLDNKGVVSSASVVDRELDHPVKKYRYIGDPLGARTLATDLNKDPSLNIGDWVNNRPSRIPA